MRPSTVALAVLAIVLGFTGALTPGQTWAGAAIGFFIYLWIFRFVAEKVIGKIRGRGTTEETG